jgi:hypothetical protein
VIECQKHPFAGSHCFSFICRMVGFVKYDGFVVCTFFP